MAEATYVHLANDGGIFAVCGGTGQAGWITRAILLEEINAARQRSGSVLISTDQSKGRAPRIVAETQLMIAASNLKIVSSPRIDPGAIQKDGITTLMKAAYVGREDLVRDLVDRGVDTSARDIAGYTALMCAAYAGKLEVVKLLIGAGSDVNASDLEGSTPLMFAAQNGHCEVVEALVKAGANPNLRGKKVSRLETLQCRTNPTK